MFRQMKNKTVFDIKREVSVGRLILPVDWNLGKDKKYYEEIIHKIPTTPHLPMFNTFGCLDLKRTVKRGVFVDKSCNEDFMGAILACVPHEIPLHLTIIEQAIFSSIIPFQETIYDTEEEMKLHLGMTHFKWGRYE